MWDKKNQVYVYGFTRRGRSKTTPELKKSEKYLGRNDRSRHKKQHTGHKCVRILIKHISKPFYREYFSFLWVCNANVGR